MLYKYSGGHIIKYLWGIMLLYCNQFQSNLLETDKYDDFDITH